MLEKRSSDYLCSTINPGLKMQSWILTGQSTIAMCSAENSGTTQ
jgi:hypothetical protein